MFSAHQVLTIAERYLRRHPLDFVAMALSLGDLGVIALFGSEYVKTLPYLLLERLSAYRTQDAAGLALMLGALCFGLMMFADWASRRAK